MATMEQRMIGPTEAAELLQMNGGNRPISKVHVEKLARAMRLHIEYHRWSNEIATLGHDSKYGEKVKPLTWRDRVDILAVYPGAKVQLRVRRSRGQIVTLNANRIMEAREWLAPQRESA